MRVQAGGAVGGAEGLPRGWLGWCWRWRWGRGWGAGGWRSSSCVTRVSRMRRAEPFAAPAQSFLHERETRILKEAPAARGPAPLERSEHIQSPVALSTPRKAFP